MVFSLTSPAEIRSPPAASSSGCAVSVGQQVDKLIDAANEGHRNRDFAVVIPQRPGLADFRGADIDRVALARRPTGARFASVAPAPAPGVSAWIMPFSRCASSAARALSVCSLAGKRRLPTAAPWRAAWRRLAIESGPPNRAARPGPEARAAPPRRTIAATAQQHQSSPVPRARGSWRHLLALRADSKTFELVRLAKLARRTPSSRSAASCPAASEAERPVRFGRKSPPSRVHLQRVSQAGGSISRVSSSSASRSARVRRRKPSRSWMRPLRRFRGLAHGVSFLGRRLEPSISACKQRELRAAARKSPAPPEPPPGAGGPRPEPRSARKSSASSSCATRAAGGWPSAPAGGKPRPAPSA